MTQEQKAKIEQVAKNKYWGIHFTSPTFRQSFEDGFKVGAQNILDNYHDYGLQSMEKYEDLVSANVRLGAENIRYRKALEELMELHTGCETSCIIIEEALKQQDK